MTSYESTEKSKHHENQDIRSIGAKPLGMTEDMDGSTDFTIDIPTNENIVPTDLSVEQTLEETDVFDADMDKENPDRILKQENAEEIDKNNERSLENSMFITMRIYETYYGRQRPQSLSDQEQFMQQPMQPHYQSDFGGGGGSGGEPLTYDPGTRSAFVKLVFSIVLVMVLVTSVFIALVLATDNLKFLFRKYYLVFLIVGLVLLLICHYAIYCSACARVPPCNIIILILAVAAYCLLAGNLSARYKTELVLYAAVATTAVCFVCLLLACTRFDFTSWLLYVIAIATVFCVISAIIFVGVLVTSHYPKPLHIAMLVIGTILQVVVLIMELQMILGGKSVELNEDDYALGAFMMYTSIMSLFMHILHLIGLTN